MPLTAEQGLYPFQVLWILIPILSYLLGSIPFGKVLAHWVAEIDITRRGSGNIGATNVAREIGVKWGILTLFLDGLKGFLPCLLSALHFPQSELLQAIAGLSALLGHQYSIYLRFRGGKGFATALGVYLSLSPVACLIALLVFAITLYGWRFVSVGSMVSACIVPLVLVGYGKPGALITTTLIMAILIVINHRDNLRRLANGQERKWGKRPVRREDPEDVPTPHRNKTR
jgi:glycerol-3-phosphate acyltransferase PlsY